MKDNLVITNLRSSIFLPLLPFKKENIEALNKIVPDFLPALSMSNSINVAGMLIEQSGANWMMVSTDRKRKIVFQDAKIDFISEIELVYSKDAIKKFAVFSNSIFKIVMDLSGVRANRLAIAPQIKINDTEEHVKTWVNSIFKKNEFKRAQLDINEFSQIYRVNEVISEKTYLLNYLSKFSSQKSIIKKDGKNAIVDQFLLDVDINTFVDPNYEFNQNSVKDFFDRACDFCEDLINFYFNK